MKKSYEIIKEATEEVGIKAIASQMKLSQSLVYKWCQKPDDPKSDEIASGAYNPLDRIQKIYEATEDERLVRWICEMAGGFFVKNASANASVKKATVLKNIQGFIKEFSEALEAISDSYNSGKRITVKEAERIRKEWEDLKSLGEGFVIACENGEFNQQK